MAATTLALVAVVASCSSSPSASPATSTTEPPELVEMDEAAMQATFDEMASTLLVPGAVGIVRTPSGTYPLTYGTTELGVDDEPTTQTAFRIGSVTKTMTAAVILQLVEEGELALDDPISAHLDGVPGGDAITIADLLDMRSGLHNYLDTTGFETTYRSDPTRVWAPQELLELAYAEPASFEPGTRFEYSNTNTILLGLLAEEVEGAALASIMEGRLFEPLGMSATFLPDGATTGIPEPFAHGYQYGPLQVSDAPLSAEERARAEAGDLPPNDVTVQSPSWGWAAGGAISTAEDLLVWIDALNRGRVLDAPMQQEWTDSVKVTSPEDPKLLYGYGIEQVRFGEIRLTFHEGQLAGFNTMAMDDPEHDVSIVVWTNRAVDDGRDTAFSMAAGLLVHVYRTPADTPPA